ncbi:hypothetical protein AMTRI_Chr09g19070 [Amborella trichopoda]
MQEKQAKGMFFNCNEKFVPGHCCKKLFLIEGCYEEEDDNDKPGQEEDIPEEFREILRAPETMRVKGSLAHVAVMVLIHSGSNHNFMSETIAKNVDLQSTNGSHFEVMVASEEKLLRLGYEVVLGAQCLRTLSPIMWDFARLLMTFKVAGKEVTLKGVASFNDKVIGDHEFNREARRNKKGCCYTNIRMGLNFLRLMAKINLPGCNVFWKNSRMCSRSPRDYHLHDHMIIGFH